MAYFGSVNLTAICQLGLDFDKWCDHPKWFCRSFLVKVRLFILILQYKCFAHELLMQQVRMFVQICEKIANRFDGRM